MTPAFGGKITSGANVYAIIYTTAMQAWTGAIFEAFSAGNIASYAMTMSEVGTSGWGLGTFPGTIPPGNYFFEIRQRVGGSPAASDPVVWTDHLRWNGSAVLPVSHFRSANDAVTVGALADQSIKWTTFETLLRPTKVLSEDDGLTWLGTIWPADLSGLGLTGTLDEALAGITAPSATQNANAVYELMAPALLQQQQNAATIIDQLDDIAGDVGVIKDATAPIGQGNGRTAVTDQTDGTDYYRVRGRETSADAYSWLAGVVVTAYPVGSANAAARTVTDSDGKWTLYLGGSIDQQYRVTFDALRGDPITVTIDVPGVADSEPVTPTEPPAVPPPQPPVTPPSNPVTPPGSNQAPVFSSTPALTVTAGEPYIYRAVAADPEGLAVTLTLPTKPSGMAIDAEGLITWDTTGVSAGTTASVVVRASDGTATTDQSYTITVRATVNRLPRITQVPPSSTIAAGVTYSRQVVATDPGDTITFSLRRGPVGMTINASTGWLAWDSTSSPAGTFPITVRATDSQGAFSEKTFNLTVTAAAITNGGPYFTSSPIRGATIGTAYNYDADAVDPEGQTLTWSVSGPAGMTINTSTGVVSWDTTGKTAGSYSVTISVTDGTNTTTQAFSLVLTAPVNQPPQITSAVPSPSITAGTTFSHTMTASDTVGDTLTWTLTRAPVGMSINASTGAISWNTTGVPTSAVPVTVRVTDASGAADEQTFNLEVTATDAGVLLLRSNFASDQALLDQAAALHNAGRIVQIESGITLRATRGLTLNGAGTIYIGTKRAAAWPAQNRGETDAAYAARLAALEAVDAATPWTTIVAPGDGTGYSTLFTVAENGSGSIVGGRITISPARVPGDRITIVSMRRGARFTGRGTWYAKHSQAVKIDSNTSMRKLVLDGNRFGDFYPDVLPDGDGSAWNVCRNHVYIGGGGGLAADGSPDGVIITNNWFGSSALGEALVRMDGADLTGIRIEGNVFEYRPLQFPGYGPNRLNAALRIHRAECVRVINNYFSKGPCDTGLFVNYALRLPVGQSPAQVVHGFTRDVIVSGNVGINGAGLEFQESLVDATYDGNTFETVIFRRPGGMPVQSSNCKLLNHTFPGGASASRCVIVESGYAGGLTIGTTVITAAGNYDQTGARVR